MQRINLWARALVFTVLVPGILVLFIPQDLRQGPEPAGLWRLGWILFGAGTVLYLRCLTDFMTAGGTPAIFFTRAARWLVGEEPQTVVRSGLYRFSRNPIYVGALCAIAGQAVVYRSQAIAIYLLGAAIFFHLAVVLLEEPHLARTRGPAYDDYRRRVPRWLGINRS